MNACETFIKERLRSPSTYNQINAEFSGVAFKKDGRNVKMVSVEYDAANAYGTPVRSKQSCHFEVGADGQFLEAPDLSVAYSSGLATTLSEFGMGSEISPCCIKNTSTGNSNDRSRDASREPNAALRSTEDAADAAVEAASAAASAAAEARGN